MTKKMHWIATRLRSHKSRASTFWMLVVLLVALPRGQAASAQDLSDERGPLPTLEITPGASRGFKAAVLRFHTVGPPVGEERIDTLRKEIEKGLAFSTVVQPLDREAYLASDDSPSIEAGGIDCDAWKQSGADALLFGEVKRDGSRLRTDIRIMDVGRCHELMSGKVIGDRDGLAKLGRRIADEAVGALTGLRGVASTEIAFISDRSGNRELYVMSADGRDERPRHG